MDELQIMLKNLQETSGNLHPASTNLPAISSAVGRPSRVGFTNGDFDARTGTVD